PLHPLGERGLEPAAVHEMGLGDGHLVRAAAQGVALVDHPGLLPGEQESHLHLLWVHPFQRYPGSGSSRKAVPSRAMDPISMACSLDDEQLAARRAEWQALANRGLVEKVDEEG